MDFITPGVFAPPVNIKYKTNAHIDSIKANVENIVNMIAKELCISVDINIDKLEDKIKEKYPDYKKLCSVAGICNDDQIIFNRNRIKYIIEQLQKDRDFVRLCRFKYRVVHNIYNDVNLQNVIYGIDNNYNIKMIPQTNIFYQMPFIMPSYYSYDPAKIYFGLFGGDLGEKYDETIIGKMLDIDTIKDIKLIDFSAFQKEYEDRLKKGEYISQDIIKVYQLISRLNKCLDDNYTIIDIIDEMELLFKYYKLLVVPYKTYKQYKNLEKSKKS